MYIGLRLSAFEISESYFVTVRIDGDIFAGERCHFMGDINHWTGLEKALFFYGRPLCHKHVIRILRLAEYVHDTSVEGIGMIAALMIERVPEAASYMLPRSAVKSIIAGVFVGWAGIVLCLYKHGLLSPVACYATGRIVRVPVIHIVTPFACEVSQLFLDIVSRIGSSVSIERMGKKYLEMFFPFGFAIASAITIGIWIFCLYNVMCVPGEICRIPCLVQDRFPHPYARMIAVSTNQVTDIAVYPLCKDRGIIPELPARGIDDYK